jgi:hypothetical protein
MFPNYIIYVITYNSLIINKLHREKSKNYKDLRVKVYIPKLTTHN